MKYLIILRNPKFYLERMGFEKNVENEKKNKSRKQHILFFPQWFSPFFFFFSNADLNLTSANASNLDQSRILAFRWRVNTILLLLKDWSD